MKTKLLFLTLFLAICFSVSAQVDTFQKNIETYLVSNGTSKQYAQVHDDMFTMLKKQFSSAKVPENLWAELSKNKAEDVGSILRLLNSVYRKHFTEQEIIEMTAFYQTEVGKLLVSDPGQLTDDQKREVNTFYQKPIGQRIGETREELSKDVSQASEMWSRELYMGVVEKLSDKGYHPRN